METIRLVHSFEGATFTAPDRIGNVVVLGGNSRDGNGNVKRRYPPDVMRAAVPLYEGVRAFVNHPTAEQIRSGMRDVKDLAGRFVNARFEEGKIKCDFEGLPHDPAAEKFVNIARTMPNIAGFSQDAHAKVVREGAVQVVQEIVKVSSIDLVANPATTGGIFESQGDHKHTDAASEYVRGVKVARSGDVAGMTGRHVTLCDLSRTKKKSEDGQTTISAKEATKILRQ